MRLRLFGSPQRTSILVGIILAVGGYFLFIGATQSEIETRTLVRKACADAIKTANDTIENAKNVDVLTQAVLQQVNGTKAAANETNLIADAWDEVQRIASSNKVLVTDLYHDRVQTSALPLVPAATPTPAGELPCLPEDLAAATAPSSSPTPGGTATPGATDAATGNGQPQPGQGASSDSTQSSAQGAGATAQSDGAQDGSQGATRGSGKSRKPLLTLQVLPMIVKIRGRYLDNIRTIAAFSQADVLLRFQTSTWDVRDDGTVNTAITVLIYPPLRADSNDGPIGNLSAIEGVTPPSPGPSASPEATGTSVP